MPEPDIRVHEPTNQGWWHYTSLKKFESIVRNARLRLMHSALSSDSMEGSSASRLLAARLVSMDRYGSGFTIAAGLRRHVEQIKEMNAPFFAVSFCNDGDLLNQFRLYGDDANGVSISIDKKAVATALSLGNGTAPEIPVPVHIGACRYVHQKPRYVVSPDAFTEFDTRLERIGLGWSLIDDVAETRTIGDPEPVLSEIRAFLRNGGMFLKHGAFFEERESRVTVLEEDAIENGMPISILEKRRYIEADLTNYPDWIVMVYLGPGGSDSELDFVKRLLADHGHHAPVERLDAPYLGRRRAEPL